jgi:hypothetical protein
MPVLILCAVKADDSKPDGVLSPSASAAPARQPLEPGTGQGGVSYICGSTNAEPAYGDLPLGRWIQSKTDLNPKRLPLRDLLSLKHVSAADDRGTVRFEVPINYNAAKANVMGGGVKLGWLNKDGEFVECCFTGYEPTTNGDCAIWWNINYDAPGKHCLRASLSYYDGLNSIEIVGPPLTFCSSNVCQFLEGSSLFNSTGAVLQAKLREQVATYRIDLKTVNGKHLKTIIGSTTNGMIDLDWDLTDEHGKKFNGASFEGAFRVAYPGDKTPGPPAKATFNKVGE